MKDKYLYVGFVCVIAYMLPYLILGENAYITIHDFLDQNVVIMAMLKNTGLFTSINGIVPNMEGLDRTLFPFFTPFDVKMVSYLLLPTFWAIITYTFVYKIIAFLGMYLLLDNYVFKKDNKWITLLLSLGFSFVPFYMELALSGAGFPFLAYAFLNLYYNKQKAWSFVAIAFYSFNSLLAYGGFFFLALLFVCIVLDYNRTKKFSKNVVYGAAIMCLVYLVANWGTFYSLFFSDSFVSHRTEWVHTTSLVDDMKEFLNLILFSQYHAGTCFAAPVILLFLYIFIRYRKKYPLVQPIAVLYLMIISGILAGMLLKFSHIQLFVTIQFDRFYFFYPSIIFLLLAVCCYVIICEGFKTWYLFLAIYGLFCGFFYDSEQRMNVKIICGVNTEVPTYHQFFDTDLFYEIHRDLGTQPDYKTKTVSIGMYPSVAEYNGFWTLDSYRVNYPAEYKHKFRNIIAKELEKNDDVKECFDDWGSRCYVFSAELFGNSRQYLRGKNDNALITLDIDTKILKGMECEYILSAVDIANYKELNLSLIGNYSTDKSFWNVRVYKVL